MIVVPLKLLGPEKVLFPLSSGTFAERRASAKTPVVIFAASRFGICDGVNWPEKFPPARLRFVKPAPLPAKPVAVTVPLTCNALAGAAVPMPTPPPARMRN